MGSFLRVNAYEYKVLTLPAAKPDVDEEILNLHGERGWELVSVVMDPNQYRIAYLRRLDATGPDLEATAPSLPEGV